MPTTTKYRVLFSIRCSHEYYQNGECTDLALHPTPECSRLLQENGLKFRQLPDGAAIYFRAHANNEPQVPVTDIPDDARFTFVLALRNPDFHRFTSLGMPLNKPVYSIRNYIFYFDSNDGVAGAVGDTQTIDLLPAGAPVQDGLNADTIDVSGNAKMVVESSSELSLPALRGILGDNDTEFTSLSDEDQYFAIELMDTVPAGVDVSISMRKDTGPAHDRSVRVDGSVDALSWTLMGTEAVSSTSFSDHTLTVNGGDFPQGLRYLRFTKKDSDDGELVHLGHVEYSFTVADTNEAHHLPQSLFISGSRINFDVADNGETVGTLSVTGPDPGLPSPLLQQTIIAEGGRFRSQVDLSKFPPGKYTFDFTAGALNIQHSRYVDDRLMHDKPFGVIEVRNTPGTVWDNVPEVAQPHEVIYQLSFTPRKSVWRYFIIHRSEAGSPADYVVRDDENQNAGRYPRMVFEDRTADFLGPSAQFQGYPARVWVSVYDDDHNEFKPIRFLEEANPDINLYHHNGGLELVRSHLPNPRPDSFAESPDFASVIFSDVFVYT